MDSNIFNESIDKLSGKKRKPIKENDLSNDSFIGSYTVVARELAILIGEKLEGKNLVNVKLGPGVTKNEISDGDTITLLSQDYKTAKFVKTNLQWEDFEKKAQSNGWVVVGYDAVEYFDTYEEFIHADTGYSID